MDAHDGRATGIDIAPAIGSMVGALARRQQALVNDVLLMLDELEQDETNPQRLERLFRVDHLATLLGRSVTSLGVLLDSGTPGMDDPLPLAEVLQAAVAGVEDFRRVILPPATGVDVAGEAVLDLVHLLTEIIDHSLASSSTHTVVDIHPSPVDGQIVIRVSNPALMLGEGPLEAINAMLRADGPAMDGCPHSLGLYVASRLALRHGVGVRLGPQEGGGTTADIRIPGSLFVHQPTPSPAPSPAPLATEPEGRHRKESPIGAAITNLALLHHRAGVLRARTRTWAARSRT